MHEYHYEISHSIKKNNNPPVVTSPARLLLFFPFFFVKIGWLFISYFDLDAMPPKDSFSTNKRRSFLCGKSVMAFDLNRIQIEIEMENFHRKNAFPPLSIASICELIYIGHEYRFICDVVFFSLKITFKHIEQNSFGQKPVILEGTHTLLFLFLFHLFQRISLYQRELNLWQANSLVVVEVLYVCLYRK